MKHTSHDHYGSNRLSFLLYVSFYESYKATTERQFEWLFINCLEEILEDFTCTLLACTCFFMLFLLTHLFVDLKPTRKCS